MDVRESCISIFRKLEERVAESVTELSRKEDEVQGRDNQLTNLNARNTSPS